MSGPEHHGLAPAAGDEADPQARALAARLAAPPAADTAAVSQLRAELAARADREGLLELAYSTAPSPFGDLLVVASEAGVVRVAFDAEGHDRVLEQLADSIGSRVLRTTLRTEDTRRQLGEYFDGRRRRFEVALDLRLVSGFRRRVVEQLDGIEYGTTASYAALAERVGNPAAVRAVGSACAHNPVPLLLPCHRVVRSDGSVGQYLGGAAAKAALLQLEAGT
jgi:methylated-DNA-[protein]-cysteine S-methyltransferase